MAIDQAKLGQHVADQMEAIENDPDIPDGAVIGEIITIVQIQAPGKQPGFFIPMIRVRPSMAPLESIGFLEAAKAIQMASVFSE